MNGFSLNLKPKLLLDLSPISHLFFFSLNDAQTLNVGTSLLSITIPQDDLIVLISSIKVLLLHRAVDRMHNEGPPFHNGSDSWALSTYPTAEHCSLCAKQTTKHVSSWKTHHLFILEQVISEGNRWNESLFFDKDGLLTSASTCKQGKKQLRKAFLIFLSDFVLKGTTLHVKLKSIVHRVQYKYPILFSLPPLSLIKAELITLPLRGWMDALLHSNLQPCRRQLPLAAHHQQSPSRQLYWPKRTATSKGACGHIPALCSATRDEGFRHVSTFTSVMSRSK